ncbi:short-chain dehydrogenase [Agrocybe pediades]|nr:short-chain dehydrogenase [Agrocybe pediades]
MQGKVAIVTGGSQGIGAATTQHLASQGAYVVFTYSSSATLAEELAEKINAQYPSSVPPRVTALKSDAGSITDIKALVAKTLKVYGRIDILVLNAAVAPTVDLEHTSEETFDSTISINVKGPYFLAQEAAPHLKPGSRIIFLSTSLAASSSVKPFQLLYVATKGAVEQIVRVLSKDLATKGITVNAVAPGATGTAMFYKGKTEEMVNQSKSTIPMGRLGTPEEIAEVITWLAGESSGWVTGQVIRANGGSA